jgi:hypothetical protein
MAETKWVAEWLRSRASDHKPNTTVMAMNPVTHLKPNTSVMAINPVTHLKPNKPHVSLLFIYVDFEKIINLIL